MSDKREKVRQLCEHVTRRIAAVVPAGFGREDAPWIATAPAADAFQDALDRWEAKDSPSTRAELQKRADALVLAWRAAAGVAG